MTDKIFENKETNKDKLDIDELTTGEIYDVTKPLNISNKIQKIIDSDYGLLVVNHESKAVRIVKINSKKIIKLVICLKDPMPFVKHIMNFYKENNVDIVFTTGICFRGEHMEDCLYESYLNLDNAKGLTEVKLVEELEKIEGIEKIFTIPVNVG